MAESVRDATVVVRCHHHVPADVMCVEPNVPSASYTSSVTHSVGGADVMGSPRAPSALSGCVPQMFIRNEGVKHGGIRARREDSRSRETINRWHPYNMLHP